MHFLLNMKKETNIWHDAPEDQSEAVEGLEAEVPKAHAELTSLDEKAICPELELGQRARQDEGVA